MIPLPVITALVAGLVAGAGIWQIQENRYETVLAERTADHATALAQANADALAKTLSLQAAKDKALKAAAVRQSALARDAAGARTALVGLSDAADSALRGAKDSHGACLATAAAQGVVLNQCGTRLSEVAGHADQWYSEAVTLREAWPVQSAP
jgi:hypothetical protein